MAEAEVQLQQLSIDLETAQSVAVNLQDESTAEIEQNIADIEQINLKVRANLTKEKAEEDAKIQRQEYKDLTEKIEAVRKEKQNLLTTADLPLPGLSVVEGELVYNGQRWDNMSGSEQLMVSTAIVRKLKPECGFVLIDKKDLMINSGVTQYELMTAIYMTNVYPVATPPESIAPDYWNYLITEWPKVYKAIEENVRVEAKPPFEM